SQYRPLFVFSSAPSTTEIYTLSLHDALPILNEKQIAVLRWIAKGCPPGAIRDETHGIPAAALRNRGLVSCENFRPRCLLDGSSRSEEHTSELQSRGHLVCRLLLEKKNNQLKQ